MNDNNNPWGDNSDDRNPWGGNRQSADEIEFLLKKSQDKVRKMMNGGSKKPSKPNFWLIGAALVALWEIGRAHV